MKKVLAQPTLEAGVEERGTSPDTLQFFDHVVQDKGPDTTVPPKHTGGESEH